MKWASVVLSVVLSLTGLHDAQAKRLGGGRSVGQQSGQVSQREAAKPAPAVPAPAAAPATPAAPRKPWGAMLGGLAAGLGLAWLAHALGLGEAFGQFLLFGVLILGIMMVVSLLLRSRRGAPGGLAYQGAAPVPQTPASYRPENVGNDASARPWERNSLFFDAGKSDAPAVPATPIGTALRGPSPAWRVPEGFDTEGFLTAAKSNFVSLQAAWDRSDTSALRRMMTDAMLQEIQAQLAEREAHTGGPVNQTDVVMLEAQLLGIEDLGEGYMASVEFSGLIREDPSAGPNPFREVWNMTKAKDGRTGWLVAGVQALQ